MLPRHHLWRIWLSVFVITCTSSLCELNFARAETIKLNHPLPANTSIGIFTLSGDGQYVIYPEQVNLTPSSTDPTLLVTLYRVGVDGANPTPLSYPTETEEYGLPYQIPPGSQHIYYRGQKERGGKYGLFKVPITGPISATLQLDNALPPDWYLGSSYEISADEKWVVYSAFYAPNNEITQYALYLVPANGPATEAVLLKANLPVGDYLTSFSITPDSQYVVYGVNSGQNADIYTFYSIPLNDLNQAAIPLSPPLLSHDEYILSKDSKRLLYFEGKPQGSTGESRAIHSVPIAGPMTAAIQLSLAPTPDVQIGDYLLSPDGQSLIYSLYPQTDTVSTLYRVPLSGPATASVPLNSRTVGGRFIYFAGSGRTIMAAPHGQQIVYEASLTEFGNTNLYSVPLYGPISDTVQLSAVQVPDGDIQDDEISKDSQWVIYTADQDMDEVNELYRTPIIAPGNNTIKLNSQLAPNYDVGDFLLTPNRQWVVYTSYYYSPTPQLSQGQLHVASLITTNVSISLTQIGAPLYNMAITPDSRKVIYLRGQARASELYATDLPQPIFRDVLYLPALKQ